MKQNLFRKKSLDAVASPERLDEYIKVLHPGVWGVLIAFLAVIAAAVVWFAVGTIPNTIELQGVVFPGDGAVFTLSNTDGKIQDMRVEVGNYVVPHDILAVVAESGSNEVEVVRSEVYGVVLDAKYMGDMVSAGESIASLARVEEGTNTYEILCYVPQDTAKRLEKGMEVQACPSYANREEVGYMYGYISEIGKYPVTEEDILASVGDFRYVQDVVGEGNSVEMRVSISVDASKSDAKNSAQWSSNEGNNLDIATGTVCNLVIVIEEQKAYELLFGA